MICLLGFIVVVIVSVVVVVVVVVAVSADNVLLVEDRVIHES